MAISGLTEDELKEILKSNLTPSDTVKTPERLFGRQRYLTTIDRALNSPGRQIFIFGDRGVGKTSLALTAAYIHNRAPNGPIVVNCGSATGFGAVMQAIGSHGVPIASKFETKGAKAGFNFGAASVGSAGYTPKQPDRFHIGEPQNINDALDIVRYVKSKSDGKELLIVIDEMERLKAGEDKEKFAEFIKSVPEVSENVRFMFCGIGSDLTELLGRHPSAGRILESVELPRLHHDSLWEIITTTAEKLGVSVDREKLIRIGQLSDGFPHYVHLIGENLFWAMFDDEAHVAAATSMHFREAIRAALERTEAVLRAQFDKATKKTKNTEDYEEALWAMADRTVDRRQLTEIYDASYTKVMLQRTGRDRLPRDTLNHRLLALKRDGHGNVLIGYGSGWFGFRENIMRGYVRLDAENKGIQIGKDTA